MGGNWSPPPNLPIRPGAYTNFESSGATPVEPGDFGRVGMPVKATWGPANEFVDIVTDADRRIAFGPVAGYDDTTIAAPSATNTSWLITEVIRGGSELVKTYRMVGAGATAATVTLDDWLAAPTLVLDAKYVGTRANGFSAVIAASPVFTGSNVLTISEGGVALEEWLYPADDIASLVADLNSTTSGSILVDASFFAGADPQVSEVTDLVVPAPLTAGQFKLTFNFGDNAATQTTANILFSASTVANVQTAVNAALIAGGYAAGDIVVSLFAGTDGLDTVGAHTYRLTAAVGLANQNISVVVVNGTIPLVPALPGAITVSTITAGARSPLAYGTFAMASGTNGAAITLSDYTDALSAFEAEGGFDLFSFDGVSEEDFVGLNAATAVWAITNNEAGRYVMAVVGGGSTELSGAVIATALARTALFDTEWVVNVGVSGLKIVAPGGNILSLTSAQSAPRVAGMIANAGIIGSVTFGEVTDVDSVNGPITPAQIEQLIQQGVIVFSKRGDFVRIEDGITTFISLTDEKDFTFTQVRAVRAIQQIGLDVTEIVERDWIGKKINTTSVRDLLVATLSQYFSLLEAQGVLVAGTQVSIDTRYDNTKTNVFILVLAQFQFELKRVLLTVRVPTVA